MEDWQKLHNRLGTAHRNTMHIRIGTVDLWRMHRAVYEKLREANQEWVNCRHRGTGSPKFDQLLEQAEEALKNLEGHILMAKLMDKEPR